MSAQLEPLAQVSERATDALLRDLGVVDTMRFLGQFRVGTGDYTVQRDRLFDGLQVADIARQIRARRHVEGGAPGA